MASTLVTPAPFATSIPPVPSSLPAGAAELVAAFSTALNRLGDVSSRVPGSAIVWRYLKASHQDDPLRTVLEVLLVFFIVRTYLMARTKGESSGKNFVKLNEKVSTAYGLRPSTFFTTQVGSRAVLKRESNLSLRYAALQEINELVADWTPEPLLPPNQQTPLHPPIVVGSTGPRPRIIFPQPGQDPHDPEQPMSLDQPGKQVLNLASINFGGWSTNDRLREKAATALRRYGVGSCGPAGFYGMFDVHLELERDIAAFLRVPACIIYSHAFSCISSVIPSFCKRGDIIIADRGVNFAIQKGIQISRSNIRWYEHGDYEGLERILESIRKEDKKYRRNPTASRRFIITEGIFEGDGSMVNLPKIIELKNKYKYRLILDESWSFGVVGPTGRGVTEVFDIPATAVDILTGSMATGLGAGGGLCVGSSHVVMHQRINSPASVFSASLPPLLAVAGSEAISLLSGPLSSSDPAHPLAALPTNVRALRNVLDHIPTIEIPSAEMSPLIHFSIKPSVLDALHKAQSTSEGRVTRARSHSNVSHPPSRPSTGLSSALSVRGQGPNLAVEAQMEAETARDEQERLLQEIVDLAAENGVLLSTTKRNWAQELVEHRPSIRICVTAALTKKEMEKAGSVVKSAIGKVLGKGKK
ncbi:hypothetical protein JCM11641_004270 [Rhodosporidiobolus odoratus]